MATNPQTTIPTLHALAHSQAHRCLWMLEELSLLNPNFTYNLATYPRKVPYNADLVRVFRLGKSPILTLTPTDPATPPPLIQFEPGILTEAKLILEFINEEYAGGAWTPTTVEDRRRDRFFADFATGTLTQKCDFTLLFEVLAQLMPWPLSWAYRVMGLPMTMRFKSDLLPVFDILEEALAEKEWFGGAAMGVSDFNMSWGMEVAVQRGYCDLRKYEKLRGWYERVQGREAKKAAVHKGGEMDLVFFGNRGVKVKSSDLGGGEQKKD